MSKARFTQGEWVAYYPHEVLNYGNVSVETEDGRLISMVAAYKSDLVEKTSNAHLIAAAPKMYEMLERLIGNYQSAASVAEHEGYETRYAQDAILVNLLLAEARGEK